VSEVDGQVVGQRRWGFKLRRSGADVRRVFNNLHHRRTRIFLEFSMIVEVYPVELLYISMCCGRTIAENHLKNEFFPAVSSS